MAMRTHAFIHLFIHLRVWWGRGLASSRPRVESAGSHGPHTVHLGWVNLAHLELYLLLASWGSIAIDMRLFLRHNRLQSLWRKKNRMSLAINPMESIALQMGRPQKGPLPR